MAKNKIINVFPLILVFIFNIALFISTPYNKNILNIFPLSDIIWSFIYFIVVFLLFNYYIRCSFVNFTNYKKLILIFCALLSIRIIFDFTYYFFKNATTQNIYALFIDFIFDLIFIYIIFKANTNKNIFKNIFLNIKNKNIKVIISCCLVMISFIISFFILMFKYNILNFYAIKYTADSPLYTYNSMNFIFEAQITRLIFGCISESIILYICNIIYFPIQKKNNHLVKKSVVVITKIIISILAIFIILFIKTYINRTGMISFVSFQKSSGYVGDINKTYNNSSDLQIYRFKNDNESFLCYEKNTIDITKQNSVLLSFDINTFCNYEVLNNLWKYKIDIAKDYGISQANCGSSITIDDTEVIFYSNQYIVFVENTTPKVLSFDELCNTNENKTLTKFLKIMINNGYWEFFEYGCDYLLKYDPDFINQYINRYSLGNFTENEKSTNSDIQISYMIEFSRNKL